MPKNLQIIGENGKTGIVSNLRSALKINTFNMKISVENWADAIMKL